MAGIINTLGQIAETSDLFFFGQQIRQGGGNDSLEKFVLGCFILLKPIFGSFVIGGLGFKDVFIFGHAALHGQ